MDALSSLKSHDIIDENVHFAEVPPASTSLTIDHPLPLVRDALHTILAKVTLRSGPLTLCTLAEAADKAVTGRLVILLERAERRQVAEARLRGAVAAIPLDMPVEDLTKALTCVAEGRTWWPVTNLEPTLANTFARNLETLSGQQWKVLDLMSRGRLNKQIAWDLGISEGTVKSHVSAILRKLGVERRTQAIANFVAINDGMVGGQVSLARAAHAAR